MGIRVMCPEMIKVPVLGSKTSILVRAGREQHRGPSGWDGCMCRALGRSKCQFRRAELAFRRAELYHGLIWETQGRGKGFEMKVSESETGILKGAEGKHEIIDRYM